VLVLSSPTLMMHGHTNLKFLMFPEDCLMREGLPDHAACIECRGKASTLLVGYIRVRDRLRARR